MNVSTHYNSQVNHRPMHFVQTPRAQSAALWLASCAALLFSCGCGPSANDSAPSGGGDTAGYRSSGSGGEQRQRQAEFLNRIRQSDPSYQTIEKAVLNENNELGLVLNRTVQMDSIPNLMRALLTQLNKEFPGQDLTVVAYAPTQPPARIGTARLDSRTRAMTYTPEHQNNK